MKNVVICLVLDCVNTTVNWYFLSRIIMMILIIRYTHSRESAVLAFWRATAKSGDDNPK
jgi:hypothetical protein